jgi:DNA-directed RNA polymerase subunit RPC12/RpoP
MHHKCHQQHIHTSYQCPTCLKSLADMSEYFKRIDAALAQHRMPPEYNNTYSQIYCNDCEKRSFAKFHFIYHKCGHCTGYNTKMLNTQTGLPLDAVIAKPVLVVANPINPLSRLNSLSSISSASNSVDSTYTGIWCHHCQVLLF